MNREICSESGQALLIVVFIGLLLLVSIPVVVFVNMMQSHHHATAVKNDKGTAIAEEGIDYARQAFSVLTGPAPGTPQTWNNALAGDLNPADPGHFPNPINLCNVVGNAGNIVGADGGIFRLVCLSPGLLVGNPLRCPPPPAVGNAPACQPYQIYVRATSYLPDTSGNLAPTRAMEAYFSQRTLGVTLPNGLQTDAALEVVSPPVTNADGQLTVHWGPIVNLGPSILNGVPQPWWTLWDPLDTVNGSVDVGFPRKFTAGYITGHGSVINNFDFRTGPTGLGANSNGLEYWGNTAMNFPALISDSPAAGYQVSAQTVLPGPPVLACSAACGQQQAGTAIFNAPTPSPPGIVVFDNNFTAAKNQVIYVNGDAEWDDLALDLGLQGAFIVTGDLHLKTHTGLGLSTVVFPTYQFPINAGREYPPGYNVWPCFGNAGITCPATTVSTTARLNFHGFLWVKGNLKVDDPGVGGTPWNLSGAVLVGDVSASPATPPFLQFNGNGKLILYYDDVVNHNIQVSGIQLQVDALHEIPAQ